LIRAKRASAEWRILHKPTHSIHSSTPLSSASNPKKTFWIAWKKPAEGFIKVNFNGSKSSQHAVGGYIIRNGIGHLIQAGAFNLGAGSILVAEATSMRNGLRAVVKAGFKNIFIEGNNKILIQEVQGHIQPPWEIHVLIQDSFYYIRAYNRVIVHHTFREGTHAADWLPKLKLSLSSTLVWPQSSNRYSIHILNEYNLGLSLAKRAI